jgi:hypothetical protein
MKRLLGAVAASALCLLGVVPAGAQGVSTPVVSQENVRHLATAPGSPNGGHVVVEGNRLYMGAFGKGLTAFDITNPRSPVRIGQYVPGPSNNDGPDPGARSDSVPDAAVWNGRHIVSFAGTSRASVTQQTEFLDMTDPMSPVLLHRWRGATDGEAHNGDIVDARKLWVASGGSGNNGLRIYDMQPLLQTPAAAPVNLFRGNPHTLWQNSRYREFYNKPLGGAFGHTHDIEIYTDREIELPEWEWVDQDGDGIPDPTRGLRDIALLAAASGSGSSGGAVYVIDITKPAEPVVMSKWHNSGGNSISYLHEAHFLHGDPNTIFVADEDMTSGCNEGRVYSISISDNLAHVAKLGEWAVGAGQLDAPHGCMGAHVFSSHNRHVFMGAYTAGLQVIDMRNPAQPVRAGRYIAEGMASWGALYHNGFVYTGDLGARGLDVFEFIQDPAAKAILKVSNPASRLAAVGGGITEKAGACKTDAPTNDLDGLLLSIPADKRGGGFDLRAVGSSSAAYDLDAYFFTADCTYISGINDEIPEPANPTPTMVSGDLRGAIPADAAFAYVDLFAGTPQWVYAQILPTQGGQA